MADHVALAESHLRTSIFGSWQKDHFQAALNYDKAAKHFVVEQDYVQAVSNFRKCAEQQELHGNYFGAARALDEAARIVLEKLCGGRMSKDECFPDPVIKTGYALIGGERIEEVYDREEPGARSIMWKCRNPGVGTEVVYTRMHVVRGGEIVVNKCHSELRCAINLGGASSQRAIVY